MTGVVVSFPGGQAHPPQIPAPRTAHDCYECATVISEVIDALMTDVNLSSQQRTALRPTRDLVRWTLNGIGDEFAEAPQARRLP